MTHGRHSEACLRPLFIRLRLSRNTGQSSFGAQYRRRYRRIAYRRKIG